jgi:Tol biopolymer transport system component
MFVAFYDLATGNVQNLTNQPFYDVKNLSRLGDGKSMLITARHEGGTASQMYRIAYPSGETERLGEDLFDYSSISIARGARSLAAVAAEDKSQLWLLDVGNQNSARQISTGRHDGQGVAWLSNDSLVFGSNSSGSWDLWTIGADGNNLRQLTNDPAFDTDPSAASDGSFVVFSSTREGIYQLWRLNLADNTLLQLTSGIGEFYPQISPDNQWVVYHLLTPGELVTIWKVSTRGGSPVQISSVQTTRADVSPDGKQVVSTYRTSTSQIL